MSARKLTIALFAAAALSATAAPTASAAPGDGKIISSIVGKRAMVDDFYSAWSALMRIN